jgi:hypothetical protein
MLLRLLRQREQRQAEPLLGGLLPRRLSLKKQNQSKPQLPAAKIATAHAAAALAKAAADEAAAEAQQLAAATHWLPPVFSPPGAAPRPALSP